MNRDVLEGQWKQLKGRVKQQWGRLTDDELDQMSGRYDELAGLIQERYGYSRDEAVNELDMWLNNLDTTDTRRDM
ncbi:MAG TPA: CsbD family protein [Anaerolineales bacterium]|nr:CsbD family protein [Anaerolineales bacterium]